MSIGLVGPGDPELNDPRSSNFPSSRATMVRGELVLGMFAV
jgi:hypothetical protein